jgi:diguanylate cyclase (GGDEF)-like protein/PAS domain S-box-containing protein
MNAPEQKSIEALLARWPSFRLTIAVKMLIGYLGLSVVVVLISVMTLLSLKKLNDINRDVISTETPVIEISDKLIDTILAQALYGRHYSLLRSPELFDLYTKKTEEFDSRVEDLKQLPGKERVSSEKLKSLYADYCTAFRKVFEYMGVPGSARAVELDKGLREKESVLIDFLKTMSHDAIRRQNKKSLTAARTGEEAYGSIISLGIIFIILALITTFLITRNIAGSIRKLEIATKRVAKGEFEDLPKVESYDELGQLSLYFSEMAEKLKQLKEAQDKIASLAAIVDSSADAIIGKTLEGIIVSWNIGAEKLYGYSDKEAVGRSISFLSTPDHPDELPTILEKVRLGETIAAYDTVRMRKDGTLVDVSLMESPVKDSTGKIIGASTIAHDISKLKKTEELLRRLSTIDELTGLANRRAFDLSLDKEWRRALRDGHRISLMMIDVDFFKKYNDTYGHLKGDACLKSVAEVLGSFARRPGDKVARFGGEEFVAVLSLLEKQHAASLAEKIRLDVEALRIPHEKSDINDYVTVSIGVVSIIPQQNMSPVDLIKSADEALYKAKEEGRNRVVSRMIESR